MKSGVPNWTTLSTSVRYYVLKNIENKIYKKNSIIFITNKIELVLFFSSFYRRIRFHPVRHIYDVDSIVLTRSIVRKRLGIKDLLQSKHTVHCSFQNLSFSQFVNVLMATWWLHATSLLFFMMENSWKLFICLVLENVSHASFLHIFNFQVRNLEWIIKKGKKTSNQK